MVQTPGASLRARGIRPLNEPRPIEVRTDTDHLPTAIREGLKARTGGGAANRDSSLRQTSAQNDRGWGKDRDVSRSLPSGTVILSPDSDRGEESLPQMPAKRRIPGERQILRSAQNDAKERDASSRSKGAAKQSVSPSPQSSPLRGEEGKRAFVSRNTNGWLTVVAVDEVWRVDDEWWREEPIARTFYLVVFEDGRRTALLLDERTGAWYMVRA